MRTVEPIRLAAAAVAVAVPLAAHAEETAVYAPPLRVCADPNNLPFSNREGEGFENKLAEMLAEDMGVGLTYTWHAQRRGFLRNTLNAFECDVVMGIAQTDALDTTRSYYRSTYVFVTRQDSGLDFASMNAPELGDLKVGIHVVGDDGASTPPGAALSRRGIVDNVVGFSIYGDYGQEAPTAGPVRAVADGTVDVAALWGPIGGYFAETSPVPLKVVAIEDTLGFVPHVFTFPIAMGVRKGDDVLLDRLNTFIVEHELEIRNLLEEFGVPLV